MNPATTDSDRSEAQTAVAAPKRVVIASAYSEHHRARLEALFQPAQTVFLAPGAHAILRRELRTADIAVLPTVPDATYLQYQQLRWVHCNRSGLDACATREIINAPFAVTSASGRSAAVLAEHALFFMLALAYNSAQQLKAQRNRVWGLSGAGKMRGLEGRRVLLIGLGCTAKALVPRCLALGLQVSAFRRSAGGDEGLGIPVSSLAAGDSVDDLLPHADIVVLAASLNDSSHAMLGERQFALLKPGAMLVNVARARLTDTAALKAALKRGTLSGAGLDVTDPEPLPPWDSLWRQQNVLITPHVTPRVADRENAEIDIIEDNYNRFLSGRTLRNRLRHADLYTHASNTSQRRLTTRVIRARNRLLRPSVRRV
jgi:phosphoglycerate dehydrogenase-like enzyme